MWVEIGWLDLARTDAADISPDPRPGLGNRFSGTDVGLSTDPERDIMKIFILTIVLALFGAACYTSTEPNQEPTDAPGVGLLCPEDEPDCIEDTDLPVPSDGPEPADGPSSSGLVAEEGLSVGEALNSEVEGIIAVSGFLIMDEEGARLCELIAESMPPQCGSPSVVLEGFDASLEETNTQQGITWSDFPIIIFGELVNGVLVVDPGVNG